MASLNERIIIEDLTPEGIVVTYESGKKELIPYPVDEETGEKYVDLNPNDE